MREYLGRVRRVDGECRATMREISPSREPSTLALIEPEGHGVAAIETSAILAAATNLRLPEHRPDRRQSRYVC